MVARLHEVEVMQQHITLVCSELDEQHLVLISEDELAVIDAACFIIFLLTNVR